MKTKFLLFEIVLICSTLLFTNRVYAANESNDTHIILEETHTDTPPDVLSEYDYPNIPIEDDDSLNNNSVSII